MEQKKFEKFHTTEKGGLKITEEETILSSEKQKEIADWLKIDIEGLDSEKAQEKIDQEIAKEFGIRSVAVFSFGKFEKAKFILVKNNLKKDEIWYLLAGPVEYHRDLAQGAEKLEGTKEIRGGGIIKIDKKENKVIIYGKSYAFGEYSKEEIEEFKEMLKHHFGVEEVEIQTSTDYSDY